MNTRERSPDRLYAHTLPGGLRTRSNGFLVRSMAIAFNRYGETASRWISRGTRRRQEDEEYWSRLDNVDRAVASASGQVP